MTLNVSQLRERIAPNFPDVELIDDSTLRFTKNSDGRPFAVCYLDVNPDLPTTQEKLAKYQDHIIGNHYFEGKRSLQWNNYLYFVTSRDRLQSAEGLKAKDLIESDRAYARKFVISEDDLDSVLWPRVPVFRPGSMRTNVLSVWTDRLVEAGLDKAILSNDDLPTRLALIEASSSSPVTKIKATKRGVDVGATTFIRSLLLRRFREFPIQRSFEFGTVNLIFGANGTGKTSLLEALEWFYCGRNKRNPDSQVPYELIVTSSSGQTERATVDRSLKVFRDRNLAWYGQPEVKTNNLYLSFAQFNFLDTDAAVDLADSTDRIEDDLSKLLVGADASKTWRNIERVSEAVVSELRSLRMRGAESKQEFAELEKRLGEASAIRQESDSIRARLTEMLQRVGWSLAYTNKEEYAGKLVESLSELLTSARLAASFYWTETPVSTQALAAYCREKMLIINKVEGDIARLEVLEKRQRGLTGTIRDDRRMLKLAQDARQIIEAGVILRAMESRKQHEIVAASSDLLAGIGPETLELLSAAKENVKVADWHKDIVLARSHAESLLTGTKLEYEAFRKLRDQSLNLSQELRQIASRILAIGAKPDECPLCHTQFSPGELARHVQIGIDEQVEAAGQKLLTQLLDHETALKKAISMEAASDWLIGFCRRASLRVDISVQSARAKVGDVQRALTTALAQLDTLNKELREFELRDLTEAKLNEILDQLRELGNPTDKVSSESLEVLSSKVKEGLAKASQNLDDVKKQIAELQKELESALDSSKSGIEDFRNAVAQLKERFVTTDTVLTALKNFSSSFPWSSEKPLAELVVEAESTRNIASELQTALSKEKLVLVTQTESIKRREHLQGRIDQIDRLLLRLTEASQVLDGLQKHHSLKDAMESALEQNRAAVEEIFSYIHSPAEFRGLGSRWNTLVRKTDNSPAKLSEISSGQRAALALSIFLAQNAQLTAGPPVILMDDPIAHVDDLNSLSFLDYLREIVLTGRRQIYFATANDKLATLFERKFDFLGVEGFRRFDLGREPQLISN
jgi:DNA repair protein SbcC/Rad50